MRRIRALEFVDMRELLPEEVAGGGPQYETAQLLQPRQLQKEAPGHEHFHLVTGLRVPGRGTGNHTPR